MLLSYYGRCNCLWAYLVLKPIETSQHIFLYALLTSKIIWCYTNPSRALRGYWSGISVSSRVTCVALPYTHLWWRGHVLQLTSHLMYTRSGNGQRYSRPFASLSGTWSVSDVHWWRHSSIRSHPVDNSSDLWPEHGAPRKPFVDQHDCKWFYI